MDSASFGNIWRKANQSSTDLIDANQHKFRMYSGVSLFSSNFCEVSKFSLCVWCQSMKVVNDKNTRRGFFCKLINQSRIIRLSRR